MNFMTWVKWKSRSILLFSKCILDYDKSIKGNDLSIKSAWRLCDSIASLRYTHFVKFEPRVRK